MESGDVGELLGVGLRENVAAGAGGDEIEVFAPGGVQDREDGGEAGGADGAWG